jgi:hypothetical protein
VEDNGSEVVSEALREALDDLGTITLEFRFLENIQRNKDIRVPRKVVDDIGIISEKAVKGEALSHQTRYHSPPSCSSISFVSLIPP